MMKEFTCMDSKQTKSFFLAALWLVAFTSAVARSCAGAATRGRRGNRLSVGDHLAISASSGFATVCIMGICIMGLSADFVAVNREYFLAIAAGIGMLGKEQHGLMRNLLYAYLKIKPEDQEK